MVFVLVRNDRLYPEGRTLRIRGRKEKVLNAIEKVKNFVETNLHNMEVSNSGAHVRILLGMWSEVVCWFKLVNYYTVRIAVIQFN